jgi:hypothetical protein
MRLPVSGLDVPFRLPDGHDDLAILESRSASRHAQDACNILERALDALARLTTLTQLDSDAPLPPQNSIILSEQSESKDLRFVLLMKGREAESPIYQERSVALQETH